MPPFIWRQCSIPLIEVLGRLGLEMFVPAFAPRAGLSLAVLARIDSGYIDGLSFAGGALI